MEVQEQDTHLLLLATFRSRSRGAIQRAGSTFTLKGNSLARILSPRMRFPFFSAKRNSLKMWQRTAEFFPKLTQRSSRSRNSPFNKSSNRFPQHYRQPHRNFVENTHLLRRRHTRTRGINLCVATAQIRNIPSKSGTQSTGKKQRSGLGPPRGKSATDGVTHHTSTTTTKSGRVP